MSELRLRELRRRKGWTQKDLATASGVGQWTISDAEQDKRETRPSTLRRLAKALEVEVEELFEEEPTIRRLRAWKERGGVL